MALRHKNLDGADLTMIKYLHDHGLKQYEIAKKT